MLDIEFSKRHFSIAETAEYLRASRGYIHKLVRNKILRPTKLGRRTLFSGADIERALAALNRPS